MLERLFNVKVKRKQVKDMWRDVSGRHVVFIPSKNFFVNLS